MINRHRLLIWSICCLHMQGVNVQRMRRFTLSVAKPKRCCSRSIFGDFLIFQILNFKWNARFMRRRNPSWPIPNKPIVSKGIRVMLRHNLLLRPSIWKHFSLFFLNILYQQMTSTHHTISGYVTCSSWRTSCRKQPSRLGRSFHGARSQHHPFGTSWATLD